MKKIEYESDGEFKYFIVPVGLEETFYYWLEQIRCESLYLPPDNTEYFAVVVNNISKYYWAKLRYFVNRHNNRGQKND